LDSKISIELDLSVSASFQPNFTNVDYFLVVVVRAYLFHWLPILLMSEVDDLA